MTTVQILKKWPLLIQILVENGIMNRSELNFLEVESPEQNNDYRTFIAGVNGHRLTVYAEVDDHDKIIASFTEWSEDLGT